MASLAARGGGYERIEMLDLALVDYKRALGLVQQDQSPHRRNNGSNNSSPGSPNGHNNSGCSMTILSSLRAELQLTSHVARVLSALGGGGQMEEEETHRAYSSCLSLSLQVEKLELELELGKNKFSQGESTTVQPGQGTVSGPEQQNMFLSPAAILVSRGLHNKSREAYGRAVDDFTEALRLHDQGGPNKAQDLGMAYPRATIFSNRGFCHRKLEQYQKSINDYTKAIQFSPPVPAALRSSPAAQEAKNGLIRSYNNRAYCLARQGQYEEAVEDYTTVIELDPLNR